VNRARQAEVLGLLEESRAREKRQTLFYRILSAEAEGSGRARDAERLNELHADEQHHLSRLTARVLELGGTPEALRAAGSPSASLAGWEDVAREREAEEVAWYEEALGLEGMDEGTREVLREILESERHHREELGGKWMSA
jgi:bacterioferritin (cytochrome b1)